MWRTQNKPILQCQSDDAITVFLAFQTSWNTFLKGVNIFFDICSFLNDQLPYRLSTNDNTKALSCPCQHYIIKHQLYAVEQTLNIAAVSPSSSGDDGSWTATRYVWAQLRVLPPVSFTCRKQLRRSGPIAPPATKTCHPVAVEDAAVPRWTSPAHILIMRVHCRTVAACGGVVKGRVEGASVGRGGKRKEWRWRGSVENWGVDRLGEPPCIKMKAPGPTLLQQINQTVVGGRSCPGISPTVTGICPTYSRVCVCVCVCATMSTDTHSGNLQETTTTSS